MVPVAPLLAAPGSIPRVASAFGTVAAGGFSGAEVASTLGAVLGSLVGLVSLAFAISWNNRKIRREREQELQEAFDRGAESAKLALRKAERDAEFWRGEYVRRTGFAPAHWPPEDDSDR